MASGFIAKVWSLCSLLYIYPSLPTTMDDNNLIALSLSDLSTNNKILIKTHRLERLMTYLSAAEVRLPGGKQLSESERSESYIIFKTKFTHCYIGFQVMHLQGVANLIRSVSDIDKTVVSSLH